MGIVKSATRTVYTATDGTEFNEPTDAEAYQASIDCVPVVEAYIAAEHADSKERHRGTLRRLIASWEAFKVRHPDNAAE